MINHDIDVLLILHNQLLLFPPIIYNQIYYFLIHLKLPVYGAWYNLRQTSQKLLKNKWTSQWIKGINPLLLLQSFVDLTLKIHTTVIPATVHVGTVKQIMVSYYLLLRFGFFHKTEEIQLHIFGFIIKGILHITINFPM